MTEPSYVRMTRTAYDTVAVDYAERFRSELDGQPFERAMLAAFAELVDPAGPVADLGCGPGRVTVRLQKLGLDVFGVDLSPEMVALSRRTYPELRFDLGSMAALDLADDTLGGVVSWYSIVHTPPERLPAIFAEFHRVLRPGAPLLLAFQVGDDLLRLEEWYGHAIEIVAYRYSPDQVAAQLADAGLGVHARLIREREGVEKRPQAFLLARKPLDPA